MYSPTKSYQGQLTSPTPVEVGTMYYFVVVVFILLSVMSTVNVACSNQTHFVYVWDKHYIYLYTLVYVTKLFLSLMA